MQTSIDALLRASLSQADDIEEFYSTVRTWLRESLKNDSLVFYQPDPLGDLPFETIETADSYVLHGDAQPPKTLEISDLQHRETGLCDEDNFLVHFRTDENWFGALEGSGEIPDRVADNTRIIAQLFSVARMVARESLRARATDYLLRIFDVLNGERDRDGTLEELLSVVSDALNCEAIGFYEESENHFEHRASVGFDPEEWVNRQFYPRDQLREISMDDTLYVVEPSEDDDTSDLFLPLTLSNTSRGLLVAYETHYDREFLSERDKFTFRVVNILTTVATAVMDSTFGRDYEEIWDRVTNLRTESFFRTRLDQEVERGDRYGHSFSVLVFEIQNLEDIREDFGESTLNEIVRKLSDLIKKTFRIIDTACRFGNYQFGVLFPNTEQEGAIRAGERLLELVEDPFLSIGDRDVSIRLDGGVAKYPEDGGEPEDLLKKARLALYEAKQDETSELRSSQELEED